MNRISQKWKGAGAFVCFLCVVSAQNTDWIFDFANKGYDFDQAIPPTGWNGVNKCGEPDLQSPINLLSPIGVYGWVYGDPIPIELTDFEAHYLDPIPDAKIEYERKNFKMYLNQIDPRSKEQETFLNLNVLQNLYQCSTSRFVPTNFHLHSPAEHPINGYHSDIAMHVVHLLELDYLSKQTKTFVALALALQFSVDDYDRHISQEQIRDISDFFESINLGGLISNIGISTEQIPFKAFMEVIDLEHTWVYQGSGGFPPCSKKVGWMITQQVYPIEYKHMFLVRRVFLDHQDELKSTSNIRGIHPVNGHDVYVVGSIRIQASMLLLFAQSLIFCLGVCF